MNVDNVDIPRVTAITEWKISHTKLIENTTGYAAQIPPPTVLLPRTEYIQWQISFLDWCLFFRGTLTYDKEHENSKNSDETAVTDTSQHKASGFRSDRIVIRDCATPATLENRGV